MGSILLINRIGFGRLPKILFLDLTDLVETFLMPSPSEGGLQPGLH